jgi:hypothetical protein
MSSQPQLHLPRAFQGDISQVGLADQKWAEGSGDYHPTGNIIPKPIGKFITSAHFLLLGLEGAAFQVKGGSQQLQTAGKG